MSLCTMLNVNLPEMLPNLGSATDKPEWKWIEKRSSYNCTSNGFYGVWEFVVNVNSKDKNIPESLVPFFDQAEKEGAKYILFHQGN